ncbi:MAG: c-type cytochrome domain-containing protein [Planctomycetaceae bacterium]
MTGFPMYVSPQHVCLRSAQMIILGICLSPSASAELDSAALTEVKGIFRSRCLECHRVEASSTDFDILDAASLIKSEAVIPGDADGSLLMKVIVTEDPEIRMPMDLPEMPADEIEKIRRWIADGAKPFPEDVQAPPVEDRESTFGNTVGVEYVLKHILAHQREQKPDHQKYMRYFSCNHLLTRGATRDELDVQRDALAKTINHLTYERDIVQPEVIDGETASVFAVDIRKLGWHTNLLTAADDFVATKSGLEIFDLILLEYPYGIGYSDSETYDRLVTEFLKPSNMVRQIPYLRIDWFCSTALQPALYHDIMKLPHNVTDLEHDIVGVNADEDLKHEKVSRGAVILSGVSRNNRAAERYSAPHGAYWKSIDYATNVGDENIFRDPVNLHGVGGEMIFNLPNGLQGYYLADSKGSRLDAGPTEIVTDKFAEDKIVRNALSCVRCHDRGMKAFKDVVRPAIEMLPGHLGFSKKQVLALYPEQEQLSALLKKDGDRFLTAMEKVLGHPQTAEPLTPVSRRFLEDPLLLGTVTGELGLAKSEDMAPVFRSRQFSALGLLPLASKGAVRRDTWEDYFDQVVHELGLGEPVIPLDAVTRLNYAPLGIGPDVSMTTTRGSRFFAAGDKIAIIVKNNGKLPIFIELLGTGTKGETVVLVPSGTKLDAGMEHRFPEEGTITVQPSTGRELITVFASDKEFAAGTHYKGKNTADRYVHELPVSGAAAIVKKSLVLETR